MCYKYYIAHTHVHAELHNLIVHTDRVPHSRSSMSISNDLLYRSCNDYIDAVLNYIGHILQTINRQQPM